MSHSLFDPSPDREHPQRIFRTLLTGKVVDKMAGEFMKRAIDANVHA